MRKKAIIFDFDGTLGDTNQLVIDSWQFAYRTFKGREEDVAKIIQSFGEPLIDTIKKEFPDRNPDEVAAAYRGFQLERYQAAVQLFPAMGELVARLHQAGLRLALATSRYRRTTMIALDKFNLTRYFDAIVTCEDTKSHKPNPEPVLRSLELLGEGPQDAIMIGDSILDIRCAHQAGVDAGLVGWSLTVKPEDLQGEDQVQLFMEKPEDLLTYLNI